MLYQMCNDATLSLGKKVRKYKNYSYSLVKKRMRACVLVGSLGSEDEGSNWLVLRDCLGEEEARWERWSELIDIDD